MEQIDSRLPAVKMAWMESTTGRIPQELKVSQTRLTLLDESRNVELNLMTKEGDKVTLSLAGRYQGLAAGYMESGWNETGAYTRQTWVSASEYEQNFSLNVEGDLNAQERKEIRQVLKTIDKMVNHFVNDRLRPMMEKARYLGDLDTIAGLEVSMSYARQVQVTEQTELQATYDQLGKLDEPLLPIENQMAESADPMVQAAAEADALSAAMAKQMEQVRAFADLLTAGVKRIFDHHRRQVAGWEKKAVQATAFVDRMQKNLLAQMNDSSKVASVEAQTTG